MSFGTPETQKQFIDNLQAARNRIEELDELIINPQEEPIFDRDLLNLYGMLVRQICRAFEAHTLHVFFRASDDPQIIDGVMSIRDGHDNIRLQFIRLPIDNLTFAGYVFGRAKVVNVLDLYEPNPKHPDLQPTRNKVVDERLSQTTRQAMGAPILEAGTNKVSGSLLLCNNENDGGFEQYLERGINALTIIIAKSFRKNGLFARILGASKNSGKSGYVTSLLQNQNQEDSSLSIDDIMSKALAATPGMGGTTSPAQSPANPPVNDKTLGASTQLKKFDFTRTQTLKKAEVPPEKSPEPARKIKTNAEEAVDISEELQVDFQLDPNERESDALQRKKAEHKQAEETPVPANISLDEVTIEVEADDERYTTRYGYLVDHELVSEEDLKHALAIAKKDNRHADDVLEQKFKVPREEIGKSISLHYGFPYFQFNDRFDRPQNLLGNIKPEFLEKQKWLPITAEIPPPHKIIVVTPDPIRAESLSIAQMLPRPQYKLMVTTNAEFQLYFNLFFSGDQMNRMLRDLEAQNVEVEEDINDSANAAISEDELVKLVNRIISEAHARRASDIHIEPYPGNQKTVVRFRIDGELIEFVKLANTLRSRLINRIKVMADLNISDQRVPQDGKIKMSRFQKTLDIELRVATYPVAGGLNSLNLEDVVMRILASGEPLPLEKLGMREQDKKRLIMQIEKPYGLAFVCGPTGSGKTTTLHSLLKHLNRPEVKIVTAEDPVEITQPGLRQLQVDKKAGVTFATAMRSFLRADPDVIMVGEMRDRETASIGIEASLTGHLVMSTLHTNSAPEAITRLLDMGMEPLNFADSMLVILAQRLAKRLCSECKIPYIASAEDLEQLLIEYCGELSKTARWKENPAKARQAIVDDWMNLYAKDGKITLYKPKGCAVCNEGYKGRLGLYELMSNSDEIKAAIKHRKSVEELTEISINEGMSTLKMDGVHKVLRGDTDLRQVLVVCIK